MRIGLMCVLAAAACSRSNSSFDKGADLSSTSDDLSIPDDGGDDGGLDQGASDGALDAAIDGGAVACVTDQPCFTGSDPTKRNVGTCRDGVQFCVNGVLGPCSGEVLPAAESCNSLDDDCDGTADNGLGTISCGVGACARGPIAACVNGAPNNNACVPGAPAAEICSDGVDQNCDGVADDGCNCVYVAPPCGVINPATGCYATAADVVTCGSPSQPCATVKYAIEQRAGAGDAVCVASLAKCSQSAARTVFNYVESAITMKNGVSVLGGYDLLSSPSPTPQPRAPTACVARISVNAHNAVSFDGTVTTPTTLDGLEIVNTDSADNITTGVAVLGSTGAIVSNSYVYGGGGTSESHGVRVATGGTPLLTHNAIVGGTAPTAIGVSALNSAPIIRGNCDTINGNSGRCTTLNCNPAGGARIGLGFIHGRTAGGGMRSNAWGVLLTSSPGALIESSSISGSQCTGGLNTNGSVAGVRITGDASNTVVRGNAINAVQASQNAVGVWATDCAGSGPSLWLFNNERISGNSPQNNCFGDGVRAEGSCHPRIDANALIRGGEEGSMSPANGVYCKLGSQCTITRNTAIEGSSSGFPPTAAGVRCDDNSCGRIEGNRITGRAGADTFGILLRATGVLVTTNLIDGGCSMNGNAVGVESLNSFAQLQNNVIRGVQCTGATSSATSWALRDTPGTNELDVNGNNLLGTGDANGGGCVSQAVEILDVNAPGARGVYRNNILHAGFCSTSYDVREQTANAVARIFNHNDLWHTGTPTALYYSGGTNLLTTLAAVNLLTDPAGSSNFEADPMFTNPSPIVFPLPANPNYHLQNGSPCIDKGVTAVGGPATDFDNPGNLAWQSGTSPKTRTNTPDVGADEAQ
jgi:hypothetical protein